MLHLLFAVLFVENILPFWPKMGAVLSWGQRGAATTYIPRTLGHMQELQTALFHCKRCWMLGGLLGGSDICVVVHFGMAGWHPLCYSAKKIPPKK